jgi:hypothetical protein
MKTLKFFILLLAFLSAPFLSVSGQEKSIKH